MAEGKGGHGNESKNDAKQHIGSEEVDVLGTVVVEVVVLSVLRDGSGSSGSRVEEEMVVHVREAVEVRIFSNGRRTRSVFVGRGSYMLQRHRVVVHRGRGSSATRAGRVEADLSMVNAHTHSSLGVCEVGQTFLLEQVQGKGGSRSWPLRWRKPRSSRRTYWKLELLLLVDGGDGTTRRGSVVLAVGRSRSPEIEAETRPGFGRRGLRWPAQSMEEANGGLGVQ
ncbi:hypothetical protein TRIUR3_26515 [Triticum urartu]|uniref:Uncharacterized protein n=1 Tax=Triticum urartu TaxID=4572 RepID=M7ZJB7_TRIUA|nr:hypothetical protein TRIUR3_26515 [Triticum urartu]